MVELGDQPLRSRQSIRIDDEALDLVPVDAGEIEPQTDPAAGPEVGGNVETLGREVDKCLIPSGLGSAVERNAPVAVMVLEIVAESLAANLQAQVLTGRRCRRLRQRLHKRYDTHPPASGYRLAHTR